MSGTNFKIGDVVRWSGLAARALCDETATVVGVYPAKEGIAAMAQYAVVMDDGRAGTYFAAELEKVPTGQLRPITTVWHRRTSA